MTDRDTPPSQGASRFVSPVAAPEGYARELLTILIEECSEVQQRATKALRFGVGEVQPGQPFTNAERLGAEVGDLLTVLERCERAGLIDPASVAHGRVQKIAQLAKFMQHTETDHD